MAVSLLLLGRTGNGKSSTGNSIVGKKLFKPVSSNQSVAGGIVSGCSDIDDKVITVVEGPGIGDTNMKDPDDVKLTFENVETALKLCPSGFTAVIMVFKYGTRFTTQEKVTVSLIKEIFGEHVFKDYGVIVMTYGDMFDNDNEDNDDKKMSFKDWCNTQTGDIKDLFIECGNRCVLFNNRATDNSLKLQRDVLLEAVAKIPNATNPYTLTEYKKAENGRKRITVSSKKFNLEKMTTQIIEEIRNKLSGIDINGNPEEASYVISELQTKIDRHTRRLETEADGTDLMEDLMSQVTLMESSLFTKLDVTKQVIQTRKESNKPTKPQKRKAAPNDHTNEEVPTHNMAVTLLLLGRDGNGKSSTGNSILGNKFFKPVSSNQSVACELLPGISDIDGKVIKVVEGPGIGDTNMKDPDDVKLTFQNVETALKLCPSGFTAVIMVFKYGTRFTTQEKVTVSLIKGIFGEHVFRDYGVIVMTSGDLFDNDNEDNDDKKMSFKDWCNAQTGDIKDLFIECGNRCVLFNNRAKDNSLKLQRDLMLEAVAKIPNATNPYTLTEYKKAENGRRIITVSSKKFNLEKKTNQIIEEIRNKLRGIDINGNPEEASHVISELQTKIDRHKRRIETEADGTDLMEDLMSQVTLMESRLFTKLDLTKQVIQTRKESNKPTKPQKRKAAGNDHTNEEVPTHNMAVSLLLLGRDGNGKSSTGNSILGKKFFKPVSSNQSVAGGIVSGCSDIDDKVITVVEGPGIGDTNMKDPDDVKLAFQNVETALKLCPSGFTAVIMVFKYGTRFTSQEKVTVSLIKGIFGEHVFRDYGVIVMTSGDLFDNDNEDNDDKKMSFKDWCNAQTGDIKDLFIECGNRCVLFNNRAKDNSLKLQRDVLLEAVAKIPNATNPYTLTEYKKAENGRKIITVSSKKFNLEKKTNQIIEEIRNKLRGIDINGNPEEALYVISELQTKIDRHKRRLETEADGTDLMENLMIQVRIMESRLVTKLDLTKQVMKTTEESNLLMKQEKRKAYNRDHRNNKKRSGSCCCAMN